MSELPCAAKGTERRVASTTAPAIQAIFRFNMCSPWLLPRQRRGRAALVHWSWRDEHARSSPHEERMATPEMMIHLLASLFSTAWTHDAVHPAQLVDYDRLAIKISSR